MKIPYISISVDLYAPVEVLEFCFNISFISFSYLFVSDTLSRDHLFCLVGWFDVVDNGFLASRSVRELGREFCCWKRQKHFQDGWMNGCIPH